MGDEFFQLSHVFISSFFKMALLGGGHTMQHTNDVSLNCPLETYIILLTNVNPINLI